MDFKDLYPSLGDFEYQINTFFPKEDIDFQKELVFKIGFQTWENYLKEFYCLFLNGWDYNKITNEIGASFPQKKEFVGSIHIIFNKHENALVIDEWFLVHEKLKTFEQIIQDRFNNFEKQSLRLFVSLLLDKHKNEPLVAEFVAAFLKDGRNQLATIMEHSLDEGHRMVSAVNSILLPNSNAVIKKYVSPNFYFPEKAYLLRPLHDELVKNLFIEPNDDFEKLFASRIKPPELKPTLWLTDVTKLYFLLYRLNNNKEFCENFTIDGIANQLFCFKVSKTKKVMRTNFLKAFKKFENQAYIKKKMFEIECIFKSISYQLKRW